MAIRSYILATCLIVITLTALIVMYMQYQTARQMHTMLTKLLTHTTLTPLPPDVPTPTPIPTTNTPPTPTPKEREKKKTSLPNNHSSGLLKTLLNGSTLASVMELYNYKSEVGKLGSIDSDLQQLQRSCPSVETPDDRTNTKHSTTTTNVGDSRDNGQEEDDIMVAND